MFEGVELEGWAYAVGGVRVVMDSDFDEDELATICDRLRSSLARAHPTLRRSIREIVVPLIARPSGVSAATAQPRTGQICFWCDRSMAPTKLPRINLVTLEHEAAHLLDPSSGAPDAARWEAAVQADLHDTDESDLPLVDGTIENSYPRHEQLLEDWAVSVSHLLEGDRDGKDYFRKRYPHRAAIIDHLLGG